MKSENFRKPKKNRVKSAFDHLKRRQRKRDAPKPACISTLSHENIPAHGGDLSNLVRARYPKLKRAISTRPKPKDNKDGNRKTSRQKHKGAWDLWSKRSKASYSSKALDAETRQVLRTLRGTGSQFAAHAPSSDVRTRCHLGYRLIDQFEQLHQRRSKDLDLKVYHVTFVSDEFQLLIRGGEAQPKALAEKIQHVLRQYTDWSAFGVVENQIINNYPKGTKGCTMSVHAHVLCWGYDEECLLNLISRAKGFKAGLTKLPIYARKVGPDSGDFTQLARYMMKPPLYVKRVDYKKLEAGKPCLKSTKKQVSPVQCFRLFEYAAKLPVEHMIFGVREGVGVRTSLFSSLRDYQKYRKATALDVTDKIDVVFESALRSRRKWKNYEPLKVKYVRNQL